MPTIAKLKVTLYPDTNGNARWVSDRPYFGVARMARIRYLPLTGHTYHNSMAVEVGETDDSVLPFVDITGNTTETQLWVPTITAIGQRPTNWDTSTVANNRDHFPVFADYLYAKVEGATVTGTATGDGRDAVEVILHYEEWSVA